MLNTARDAALAFRPFPNAYTTICYLSSLVFLTLLYYAAVYTLGFVHEPPTDEKDPARWRNQQSPSRLLVVFSPRFEGEKADNAVDTGKKRSWILTGSVALVMTSASLPFVWDLMSSGLDVGSVRKREALAQGVTAFFMAYLNLVSGLPRILAGAKPRQEAEGSCFRSS
jgi:hypothetical protein